MKSNINIVLLAGGSGTRFWPLSRERFPKQFMKLFDGRSMFGMTVERSLELAPPESLWIVTLESQAPEVRTEIFDLNIPQANILEEPVGRNTAPAVGLAAMEIAAVDENA